MNYSVQTLTMFTGEIVCLFAYQIIKIFTFAKKKTNPGQIQEEQILLSKEERLKKTRKINPMIFAIPSCIDMIATSLLYVGLILVWNCNPFFSHTFFL